jgi:hypothetical protein
MPNCQSRHTQSELGTFLAQRFRATPRGNRGHLPGMAGTSLPPPPIYRPPAPMMGNGDDLHLRGSEAIDQPERKPSQGKPTPLPVFGLDIQLSLLPQTQVVQVAPYRVPSATLKPARTYKLGGELFALWFLIRFTQPFVPIGRGG